MVPLPRALWCAVFCVLFAINVRADVDDGKSQTVHELTDGTFDIKTLDGKPWVLMIYSPMCSHCRRMSAALAEAAGELYDEGFSVGKVNGVQNHICSTRFRVTKYPSVFVLKNGRTWEFGGPWDAQELLAFVRKGYRSAKPIPWHRNPTHLVSRAYGLALSVPSRLYDAYLYLHREKGYSAVALVGASVGIILAFGVVTIVLLDMYYAAHPHLLVPRQHAD